MIDPAQTVDEFEKRTSRTPDIARLEKEHNPDDMITDNALYYRAYFSSNLLHRMNQKDNPNTLIEPIDRKIRNLGAQEIKYEDKSLLIAYKPPQ